MLLKRMESWCYIKLLEVRDIVFRNNIRFPDNGNIDTKIGGHPTVNATEEIDGEIYFFRMSSQIAQYVQNKDKMVLIRPNRCNGLSKPSVVKVDHILKENYRIIAPAGYISENEFEEIMDKFKRNNLESVCNGQYCACKDYFQLVTAEE